MSITLRPVEKKDLDNMMSWVNDPAVIGNFGHFDHAITREEETAFIDTLIASNTDRSYTIEHDGEYVGNVVLHQINWKTRNGRLGLIIGNKTYWGKGYAQESLKEIVRKGFDDYQLHKIWAIVFPENKRMQHILEKFGFREEGRLRDEYRNHGGYHDMIRYSLLEDEFRSQNMQTEMIA